MSGGFTFGGNPGDGSGDGDQPPDAVRDRLMRQVRELEEQLNRVTLESRHARNERDAAVMKLEQAQQLLAMGEIGTPTVFNMIQVN
jgi:hypothetical protein